MKRKLYYQKGIVLIAALVMLLVMTAIGVTVMSGATLQERMAGNNRQQSLARINAEGALREAEITLTNLNLVTRELIAIEFNAADDGRFIAVRDRGYRGDLDELTADLSYASNWSGSNSVVAAANSTSGTAPRYTIEYLGRLGDGSPPGDLDVSIENKDKEYTDPFVFRITAIGFAPNDNIYSVLQSTFSTASN